MKRKDELRILTPCGMLGYGIPEEHFWRGLDRGVDAIVVDSGSTDPGHYQMHRCTSRCGSKACGRRLLANGPIVRHPAARCSHGTRDVRIWTDAGIDPQRKVGPKYAAQNRTPSITISPQSRPWTLEPAATLCI